MIRYYRPPETGGADPALAVGSADGQPVHQCRDDRDRRRPHRHRRRRRARTMEECATMLIGQDPFRIDNLWQRMMRGYFYPAGREKLHSLGALDLALWDLKGKALGVPVWQLLGGKSRNYVELLFHRLPRPSGGTLRGCGARLPAMRAFALIATPPTTRGEREVDRFNLVQQMYRRLRAAAERRGRRRLGDRLPHRARSAGRDQAGQMLGAAASLFLRGPDPQRERRRL